ncbi:MAG: type II toxin-antitoxin system MqsA family antitoxin [Microcystis aeruginosa S11-01]|nr:type II toxin-antitoxin system MqsA family antitoxin [Microcystis aeruginosa S11-05]NCR50384.1 type II toxin-antitoxin system MqsA family antitoxin [Microcystis aeruginosa S11-01]
MESVICKNGTTRSGFVTVTLDRDNCIVILKQVPADVCQNCGDYYLSESVTAEVLQKGDVPIRLASTSDCASF